MEKLQEKIPEIEEIRLIKDNQDGTKQYAITSGEEMDLRKKLFEILPKEDITIFELKKNETTLEEAFIKLIDSDKLEIPESKEEQKQEKEKIKKAKKENKEKNKKEKKKGGEK